MKLYNYNLVRLGENQKGISLSGCSPMSKTIRILFLANKKMIVVANIDVFYFRKKRVQRISRIYKAV